MTSESRQAQITTTITTPSTRPTAGIEHTQEESSPNLAVSPLMCLSLCVYARKFEVPVQNLDWGREGVGRVEETRGAMASLRYRSATVPKGLWPPSLPNLPP
jgi:hypothetical protein